LGILRSDKLVAKKQRRTHRELFLDKLKELSNGDQKLIGNKTLREELDWEEDRYDRIKVQLREENAILVGTGKGGSVGLAQAAGSQSLKLFISYSHADELLKNELLKHLEPLKHLNLVESWHDRKLMPGEEWENAISKNLESANIILLLVSIDFINSKYCYDIELDRALELHAQQKNTVIPIILRNCLWQHTAFAKLQALPKDAKAVCSWTDKDEAFTNIAEGIRQVAMQLMASR
jgi:hypothetical protein